jgi:hypothetical protein
LTRNLLCFKLFNYGYDHSSLLQFYRSNGSCQPAFEFDRESIILALNSIRDLQLKDSASVLSAMITKPCRFQIPEHTIQQDDEIELSENPVERAGQVRALEKKDSLFKMAFLYT